MTKYDSNYFKNTKALDKYFFDGLTLFRFNTIKDIEERLNKDFKDFGLKVVGADFVFNYENDFQDYELIVVMGNEEEEIIDISIYYAVSRIGDKVITETSYELV